MAKKPYDEVGVVRLLSNNKGVDIKGKNITVDESKNTVGNGTWGKIDYLCKLFGFSYKIGKVEKHYTPGKQNKKQHVNKGTSFPNAVKAQNTPKINIASMTRKAMKSVAVK